MDEDTDLILHINEEEEQLDSSEGEQCLSSSMMQPMSRKVTLPLFDYGEQNHKNPKDSINDSDKAPKPSGNPAPLVSRRLS